MERPSHIDINTHRSLLQRLPMIALAGSLQIAIAWLFTSGLVNHVIHIGGDGTIELAPIPKTEVPLAEPPKPTLKTPNKVTADLPNYNVAREPGDRTITATLPLSGNGTASTTTAVDRAPVSISSTHTAPPYPVVARRVGWEGKVTLRLTVLTDGHVGKAEVMASSGRGDLDDAARQWIMAHWIYKPALDHGTPAIGQAITTVTFSLENTP
jgi:protein TonB